MAVFSIKSFGGISPKIPARYLQDGQAQVAINCPVFSGSLQALPNVGSTVTTLTRAGTPQTIYRFGKDLDSDTQYWFSWNTDVNVCRSQVSGDTSEWTFYTGDGAPKATYNSIALAGTPYPFTSRLLGIPNPTGAPSVTVGTYTPDAEGASIYLSAAVLDSINLTYDIDYSVDKGVTYTNVALSSKTASAVATALDARSDLVAVVEGTGVKVTTTATGNTATLSIRIQTGTSVNTSGTFTYAGYDSTSVTGTANTQVPIILTDAEIASISTGDYIDVSSRVSGTATVRKRLIASGTYTAATLAAALTTASVTATAYGSCVILLPGSVATAVGDGIIYSRYPSNPDGGGVNPLFTQSTTNQDAAAPAQVILTQTDIDNLEGSYISTLVNGNETRNAVPSTATAASISALIGPDATVQTYGSISPIAIVKSKTVGTSATLRIREGTYPTTPVYITQDAVGVVLSSSTSESRVYVYTLVNKESGFEFESGPSPASAIVDVYDGQPVVVGSFSAVPAGYTATHRRIYRAVSGVYLFVAEIAVATTSYSDTVLPDSLSEELPSATWLPPPSTLAGLINLPNGGMAGFVGQDVYFCDPYHPHAWPIEYVQTVDYPVVGLGRMDTTLAVLTTGTPYFIQGSSPANSVVVKSDLEQACASKRSIVSANGVVIYASPDGLVMLTPGGSKMLTENYFTRDQWQTYFSPTTIHAYAHDLKYVAFYNNGVTSGGFIYDLTSGQFILHDIYATAGFSDLRRDQLFLAFSDRTIKKWLAGSAKTYTWRSKKFTLPSISGFSCAQLEAEAYPVTAKFYMDGSLFHTQTVTSRNVFRLPVKVGRDLEVQFEGTAEVFSFAIAQSPQELAGA